MHQSSSLMSSIAYSSDSIFLFSFFLFFLPGSFKCAGFVEWGNWKNGSTLGEGGMWAVKDSNTLWRKHLGVEQQLLWTLYEIQNHGGRWTRYQRCSWFQLNVYKHVIILNWKTNRDRVCFVGCRAFGDVFVCTHREDRKRYAAKRLNLAEKDERGKENIEN